MIMTVSNKYLKLIILEPKILNEKVDVLFDFLTYRINA